MYTWSPQRENVRESNGNALEGIHGDTCNTKGNVPWYAQGNAQEMHGVTDKNLHGEHNKEGSWKAGVYPQELYDVTPRMRQGKTSDKHRGRVRKRKKKMQDGTYGSRSLV